MNRNLKNKKVYNGLRRRFLSLLLSLCILIPVALVTGLVGVCYTANLSADAEVRPGHSFTMRLSLDSGAYGYQGVLEYDTSVLKLTGVKPVNGKLQKEFHVYTDTGLIILTHETPVTKMLNLTFSVSESAEIGSSTTIRFTSGRILNGSSSSPVDDVSFTVTMVDKKSSDATLASLNVTAFRNKGDAEGFIGALSPSFDDDVTHYNTTVPNAYPFYRIDAEPNDPGATVVSELEGSLAEGDETIVSVTVRAEDGSEEVYTVSIFRVSPPDVSAELSYDESSGIESSEEEPVPSEDISFEESSEDITSEESDASGDFSGDESEESSSPEFSENPESSSRESSDTVSTESSSPMSNAPVVPYQPESRDWTGVLICIAAIGGVCILALVIRIFFLFHKKQKV